MNNEQNRLLTMLNEKKISQEDYLLLSKALQKKSVLENLENSFFINPFRKIAGTKALVIGLVLMAVMSIIGIFANIYFEGVLGYLLMDNIKTSYKPNFFLLFYQNLIACLILSVLFLLFAFFYRQKKIRWIDFFGMVTLSRYPLLISVVFTLLEKMIRPEKFTFDYSKPIEMHFSFLGVIAGFVFYLCFIWQIITYFFALKEASGLAGNRLWISFIISILLGEMLALMCTRIFLFV